MKSRIVIEKGLRSIINAKGFILLDGALGTELERAGYPTRFPLWSASANTEAPELVKQIHDAYLEAGADIITANSFRACSYSYEKAGMPEQAGASLEASVRLGRVAISEAGGTGYLAGSLAPLEDCFRPEDVPAVEVLTKAHKIQIDALRNVGVDFILAETLGTRIEAGVIASLCTGLDIPFMLSFITNGDGKLLGEDDLRETVAEMEGYNPLAILLNCGKPEKITSDFALLCENYSGMKGVYANGPGRFVRVGHWSYPVGAAKIYQASARKWLSMGAKIIGGCCGSTPAMINEMGELRQGN